MTISTGVLAVLIGLLIVATITDVRHQLIYNWNTYPGILGGLGLRWWEAGRVGLDDGLQGVLACGGLMLFCFMFFGLGGGDVKLLAMIGAFLGFERGIEALLWTLVLGGVLGMAVLIWKMGVLTLLQGGIRQVIRVIRARGWVPLESDMRAPLGQLLYLAPAALTGVVIVTRDLWLVS